MPPAELEALIVTHPKVADVAVIGVPDESAGELPKAFVVVKPGMEMTAEEVQEHVAQHVASYKHIRIVEFTDAIPKSRERQDPAPHAPRRRLTSSENSVMSSQSQELDVIAAI